MFMGVNPTGGYSTNRDNSVINTGSGDDSGGEDDTRDIGRGGALSYSLPVSQHY